MEPQASTTTSTDWPGAFGAFKRSAAAVKVNLLPILVFDLLLILTSGGSNREKQWLIALVGFLLSVWVQLSLTSLYLASAKGTKQDFSTAAKVGINRYVDGFIATIVTGALAILSLLALVIPFFFVIPRLQMVMYFVVDKGMGPMDAVKASWDQTKGHSLKVWGAILVSILFALLMFVIVGIYLLFMYQAVFALLYFYITGKATSDSTPVAEAPATN
jgi:uncharacterized membrane protein